MRSDRVLVTGATGFVGAWILRRLREAHPEAEVWATSDLPEPSGLGCAHYRRVDLRDRHEVSTLLGDCRPSFVIHLASLIAGGSLEDYLSVNVIGTARTSWSRSARCTTVRARQSARCACGKRTSARPTILTFRTGHFASTSRP
jgi:UDP-glucose 4-epimerase